MRGEASSPFCIKIISFTSCTMILSGDHKLPVRLKCVLRKVSIFKVFHFTQMLSKSGFKFTLSLAKIFHNQPSSENYFLRMSVKISRIYSRNLSTIDIGNDG